MKDLLIATVGLWHLWPLGLAVVIGLAASTCLDRAGEANRLPRRMQRSWNHRAEAHTTKRTG